MQPTDLVKVRFQAEGAPLPGQLPRYRGVIDAYARIVREEGALGLWKGLGPNVVRNSVMNATELVSYDVAKEARGREGGEGRWQCLMLACLALITPVF